MIDSIKPLPQVLIELLTAKKKPEKEEKYEDKPIPAGQRNNHMASIAGAMRRKGLSAAGIESALLVENQTRCDPPLPDDEIRVIAHSIGQYTPEQSAKLSDFDECPVTDLGNARRLVKLFGNQIRYCHTTGKWMMWKGELWVEDMTEDIRHMAYDTLKDAEDQAAAMQNDKLINKIRSHQATNRINGMLTEAKSMTGIIRQDMDKDPLLFNCASHTINLKDLSLHNHNPDDLISKIAPVNYISTAKSEMWEVFLFTVMEGNQELIDFLQRMTGYSMLGNAPEQMFFILFGAGANGKSTFYETIKEALGTYAIEAASDTFLLKRGDPGIPHDMVRMIGKRLILAAETDKGRRLSEAMIKQYTGGKTIVARQLFKEFFEFGATGKIWLITNHKPNIYDSTHAMWRRVMLIPFLYKIPDTLQDKHFGDKLRGTELEGIFNWIVEGYKAWQKQGISPPAEVLAATRDYRDEMDYLGGFLAEECVDDETAHTSSSDLYTAYKKWCEDNGEKTISSKKFGLMLLERGYSKQRETIGKKRIVYKGVKLDTISTFNPVHVSQ